MRRLLYFVGSVVIFFSIIATIVENKWEEQRPLVAYLLESGMIKNDTADRYTRFPGRLFNHHSFSTRRALVQISGEAPAPSPTVVSRRKTPIPSPRVSSLRQAPALSPTVLSRHKTLSPSPKFSSRHQAHHQAPAPSPRVSSRRQAPAPTVLSRRKTPVPSRKTSSHGPAPAPSPRVPSHRQAHAPSPTVSSLRPQISGKAPLPPSTISSPNQVPSPSPTITSISTAPAPSPVDSSPSSVPSFPPLPTKNPAKSPLSHISLPKFPVQSLLPTGVNNGSDIHSSNQNISKSTVVIAVATTAAVTFSISVMLFLFWLCCCRPSSGWCRAEDKPLTWLSSSGYSTDSPHKPFSFVTMANEQMLRNRSFYNNLNHKVDGNFYMESHSLANSMPIVIVAGPATNSVETSLEMPPGMSGTPEFPPVEPPLGRIDPPTPPPGNATSLPPTPVPPPPPPPPSTKPSSSSLCPPAPPLPPAKPSFAGQSPPLGVKNSPHPPPLPSAGVPPPRPPPIGLKPPQRIPSAPLHPTASTSVGGSEAGATKAKLKPLFWDKVMAGPDHSMVWDHIRSGSFHFNEEMIENLFGYEEAGKIKNDRKKESSSQDVALQHMQLIDPKKSQNLSIMLKALNVDTDDVCAAIEKGSKLPPELIQTLLKMAPTNEEQMKLREYTGELSQLDLAEQFLKVLIDIPFVFKRLESMLFFCTLPEDISMLRESFAVLEAACTELRECRLFLTLLEAVLKTGNRMNDGTFRGGAQAFKLDTLLKLSDVKGKDGKTTLLHFVAQEIILSQGRKAARLNQKTGSMSSFKSNDLSEDSNEDSDEYLRSIGLQVVSGLDNELDNVKKAAVLDIDSLTATVSKLRNELNEARDFLNSMKNVAEENGFRQALMSNLQNAEVDISWSVKEEKRITAVVKSTGDYFHGSAGKHEGLRLFKIVREFLTVLDKVCKEVKIASQKGSRTSRKQDTAASESKPTG